MGFIVALEGSIVRTEGYTFVFDSNKDDYVKRPEKRTRIFDLSDSGYIVNIIPKEAVLEKVIYIFTSDRRLVVTDEKTFSLDINEFGPMR